VTDSNLNMARVASKHRVVRIGVVVFCALVLLTTVGYLWHRPQPAPPEPDLAGVDPHLVHAIVEARLTVLHSPRDAAAWGHLGMVFDQHRFLSEARACFSEAERLDPREVRWPYLIAQIDRLENRPGAIAELERALAIDEHNPMVRLHLAELLLEQGELADAHRHFQRVAENSETQVPLAQARATLGLARLALRRDELGPALELAQRAEQTLPAMKAPHVVLAEIHLRRGDHAAAQREQRKLAVLADLKWPDPYLEEVEQLSVDVHARIDLARRFLAQDRSAEGLALLREMVEANPQSTPARISLGQAHLRRQEWRLAQQAFEQALALDPGDATSLAELGFALSRQNQLERAVECYHQAIARNAQNPENYYQLGYCEFQRGRLAESIEALRTAVRVRPHFALAWRELGQILAQHGEGKEARVCLQRAVDLAPDDESARKLLDNLR
jgi:tetratricopeptide (TPR) repeat protein